MKQILTLFLSLFLLQSLYSQEFEVREFVAAPNDMAARRYEKRTVNDNPAALIKITTNIQGMRFESDQGVVDFERRDAEYWVYVMPRERRIRLMAEGYLAKDVAMPEPAKQQMVYHMIVTTKGILAPPTDLVRITFRMNEDNVYIRSGDNAPVPSHGRNAVFNVDKGEHTFRFIKEGFEELEQTINVQEDITEDITLTPGQVTTTFEPLGFITITSNPTGAEVYLNEQRVGITPYTHSHISGQYNIILRHSDYHDHFQTFQLEAGASMNLPTVDLKPRFGYWEIESTPGGAEVYLDGKLEGTTPLQRAQISSGYHELTVRYTLYHEHTESFTIEDGDEKNFSIDLKPAYGSMKITSDPTGAKLFVDGREVGTTPYENNRQASGRYSLRLTKDLHADASETVIVTDGETTEGFVVLTKNFGTLNVLAEDADIFLDGTKVGSNSYKTDLTPGPYTVKAKKPQHADDEREVFIRLGQTETINLSPAPKIGSLAISSQPFETHGAVIWIDGEKQDKNTPAVFSLLEGSYNVRLNKEGYADVAEHVQVKENETTQLNLTMLAGLEVTITSKPAGADLYINDCMVGKTPYSSELSFGSHKLKLINQSRIVEETINIRQGGQSSFSFNVDIFSCGDNVTFTYRGATVTYGTVERQNGTCWMDRNLGASRVATSSTDSQAYGDLFQWGRGDDGHQVRTSGTTSTLSRSNSPGHGNFITSSKGANWDWRSPQNDNLWQGVNGTNNPCPAGFRLPTAAEWNAERQSWSSDNARGAYASPLKLPVAGSRHFSNGSLSLVGSLGRYWSSTVDGTNSRYLRFHSSDAGMDSLNRAYGHSVRCLKDDVRTEAE